MLEIASFLIPIAVGAYLLLFRRTQAYNEAFTHSIFRGAGVSLQAYRLMFRGLGLFLIMVGCVVVWNYYLADAQHSSQETKSFWEDVNSDKSDKPGRGVFDAAMLLPIIAIPARMASTRFAGKPLAKLGGKTVLERVYEKCASSRLAGGAVILSDSPEIEGAARAMGAKHIMTSPDCASGTERIISVLEELGTDFVVNVQGDEPFIAPELIDAIIQKRLDTGAGLVTAARKIKSAEDLFDENVVKVLRAQDGSVLYFSRAAIPHVRGEPDRSKWLSHTDYWQHIGIYGYSADMLRRYASLPHSVLEDCEKLEQLKFVSAGYEFELVETDYVSIGIDTPADLVKAEEYLKTLK